MQITYIIVTAPPSQCEPLKQSDVKKSTGERTALFFFQKLFGDPTQNGKLFERTAELESIQGVRCCEVNTRSYI